MAYNNNPYNYGGPLPPQGPPVPPRPIGAGPPLTQASPPYQQPSYHPGPYASAPPPPPPRPSADGQQYYYPPSAQTQYAPGQHPPQGQYYSPPPPPQGSWTYGAYPPPSGAPPSYGAPPPGPAPNYGPPPPGLMTAYGPPPPGSAPHYGPVPPVQTPTYTYPSPAQHQQQEGRTYQYPPPHAPPPVDAAASYSQPPASPQPSIPSSASSFHPRPASTPSMASPAPPPRPPPNSNPNLTADMSAQFRNMGLNESARGALPAVRSTPGPLPAPVIRASGPWNEVLNDCQHGIPVLYASTWYRLPGVRDFFICSNCHNQHIEKTTLAASFEQVKHPEGTATLCRFWPPRVVKVLWPQAIQSGDLSALQAYMIRRLAVADCKGEEGVASGTGAKWFSPRDGQPQGFVACEACYEDRVAGSAFEGRFGPSSTPHRSGVTRVCDVCNDHVSRALETFGMEGKNDWPRFVSAVTHRLALPACDGNPVEKESRKWFTTRRAIQNPDLAVCETCFLDKLANTEFEHEFEPYYGQPGQSALSAFGTALLSGRTAAEPKMYSCDLAAPSLRVALDSALHRHDFSVFWTAASAYMRSPPCTPQGIAGGQWYTLRGGCAGFAVCGGCHAGFVVTSGLVPFFEPAQPPPGAAAAAPLLCSFSAAQPRFVALMLALAQTLAVGVFEPFEARARRLAGAPPCAGRTAVANGVWYGFEDDDDDVRFCTDCYEAAAAGTTLDGALALRAARGGPRPVVCCLYSARMRGVWAEACARGDAGVFVRAARERAAVHRDVVPAMDAIRRMKLVRARQAAHQGALSIRYQAMAGRAELAGTTDGYLYGNSAMGWSTTWEGAHGNQLLAGMHNSFANNAAKSMDDAVVLAQLEARWRAVE